MAISGLRSKLEVSQRLHALKTLQRKSPGLFKKAQEKGAIQFLNWANNGSAKEARKPPIAWGVLRGSSSAFVGNDLVLVNQQTIKPGAKEIPTPAKTYSAKDTVITWAWNTIYAARMHEAKYNPGSFSSQDGNAGNKWLEKHLRADKQDLMAVIGMEFKKSSGL